MGLNAKQKQAVEYLAGPLLVLAGPGTGKTQLLSEKVAYILSNTDTAPENILCLTFTETGASNMRERLKTIIGREGAKVTVSTYHGFGAEILAQYKNYATNYTRRLDSAIDEVTQFKIVKQMRDKLPGRDILRGDNVKDIISVISEAKSAGLSAADLETIAEQNMAYAKAVDKTVAPLLSNVVPRVFKASYEQAYLPMHEALSEYEDAGTILKNVEQPLGVMTRDLKAAIIEAESRQRITPLSSWKDKYFEKDGKGNYRLADRVANKKLVSVAKVMASYQAYLLENGLYDFDDMVQEAVRVLAEDEGFRLTLQEKYQFIMLDEFQDTNPTQLSIVKWLTNYEKPMVMAVGDDDQAIYEFQGALSTNMADFQAHYDAEVITLFENYRSTQEILDFSHAVIAQAPDRFGDKELVSHQKNPTKSQIIRTEFLSSDQEYDYIASTIAKLIDAGVPQSEIAVISYKTKYFLPLLPYLKAYPQIKIAYEKRDNLLENQEMQQVFNICRLIVEVAAEQRPTVSMLEVLSYPFWHLPAIEIVKLTGQARLMHESTFSYLLSVDNAAVHEVMEWFSTMVGIASREPLEVALLKVVEKMEISKLPEYERFRFYENLASLKGKLARHFGEKSLKLADLVMMLDDYTEAEMALAAVSPYRDADEAVQLLTAHKAKGLEFEHVFVVSADHTAWGKGKGNNNMLALPRNLMQIRHTGTTDGEKLRILYVTLTRAKTHLYITNSLHDFMGKSPERLEYFGEHVEKLPDDTEVVESPFLPSKRVILDYDGANRGADDFSGKMHSIANLVHWLNPYVTLEPDMRAIYRERISGWRMSASALTSFVDIVNAGPVEFFEKQILKAELEPEDEFLAMGNLIHATFERVTNDGLSDEEAIQYFLEELSKRDLASDIKEKLREEGPAELMVPLKAFAGILRQGRAEVDLSAAHLVIDGVPVTGKIDHLIVDEDAKEIEIYDFKTGGYHKDKWQSHATLFKYAMQLEFYRMLLMHSPEFSKYQVTRAHILFVKPDKDGEVYDRVYEFDSEFGDEVAKLIQVVYQMVTSLKFIDDSEVFIPTNKLLGLKDIKAFIAVLLDKGEDL